MLSATGKIYGEFIVKSNTHKRGEIFQFCEIFISCIFRCCLRKHKKWLFSISLSKPKNEQTNKMNYEFSSFILE